MIKRIQKSLMLKWMLFSILLATIPLAIAGFSIIQIYQDNLKKSVITIEKEKANMVAQRTRSFFEKMTSNLRSLSIGEHLREGIASGHIKSLLESFLNQNDYLSELTLFNEKGKEMIKVSKHRVYKPSDLKDQSKTEVFQVASNLRNYYGGFKLIEGIVPTMVIAIPVEEYQKRPADVLSAEIHLRYLWNLIQQIQIGEKGTTYVVDGEGNLIAHPDTTRVTSRINMRHLPMVEWVVTGEEGNLEFEDSGGEKYLVVYKPIKELGWGVIVQIPIEEAYAPLRQVANTALKWILIALIIALVFTFFLTKRVILPIKRLSKEMGEVSQGNLDIFIQPTTKDELGFLTKSFNQMTQDLKRSHEALKKAEEKYRRIFEDSKDMVYITSMEGMIIDVNQAGVDLLDYGSKEEMMQVYARDTFLYPEDQKRFMNEVVKEGFVKDFEVKLKRKDGTSIDVLITSNARRDDSGNIISYEGIIKDISGRKRMEEELVQRTRELETLNEMGGLINQTLVDLDTVLPVALEKAVSLIGYEMGGIYFANDKEQTLELKYQFGHSGGFAGKAKILKYGEGVSGRAVELKQPVIFSIADHPSSKFAPFLKEEGAQTVLGFPLLAKGRVVGTISLVSRSPHDLTQREVNLLESIGNQIGLALENARLFEEVKKRLDELTILYEITKVSTSSLNLDQMLTEIVDNLKNLFKFEIFGILLIDENKKQLLPHLSFKGHSIENIGKLELCLGKGITGWVAEKGEPLLVNDVKEDGRYVCGDENIRSEICTPLKVGPKIIGVIDAQSKKLNAFSENDLRLFNIAGGQIATVIENIRLQEEMRQSEEKYRTVVEGALDGVCIIGRDGRFKYVNEKLVEIQGYSREELIETDFRNYLDEVSKSLFADREDRRKKGIKLSPHLELNILRKDGEIRNVEISARSIKDSKGNVNIIVILKDVTEKKKMEERLLQSEKLRALGEMASGVAHDFNNALAVILGNTQLLLYTAKEKSLKETLKIIEKVAWESGQTVKRLQGFTRKRLDHELIMINVNSIIQDVIKITKPKWKDEVQHKGIHIEMVPNIGEISTVLGNASELSEVITNMIFNSIEAMPEGGKIEIRTFQRESHVYIQISDTGIGMTEEVRKKVFEPFFTTKPFSHAGLSLSMSYGIIRRFGGEIEVESKVGHGAIFTIVLPFGSEEKEEEAIPPFIQKGREARILVIDDEEEVRSVLSRILSEVKHQVTVAKNGEEGLRFFQEKEFDLVLTDLGMPGMSGWEVGRTIKEISPYTPVGMITGWGMEVDQTKIEENGIDFVIPKPFQFNQILKVVEETIASKEKQPRL